MYRDLPWGTNEPDMKHCALLLDVHGYWFQPYVAWEHWRFALLLFVWIQVATGADSSAPAQQWIVHTQTFLIFSLAWGSQCAGVRRRRRLYYVLCIIVCNIIIEKAEYVEVEYSRFRWSIHAFSKKERNTYEYSIFNGSWGHVNSNRRHRRNIRK